MNINAAVLHIHQPSTVISRHKCIVMASSCLEFADGLLRSEWADS